MSYCSRFLVTNLTLLRTHILCGKHRFKYNGPLENVQWKLLNCLNSTQIFTMTSHERHGVSNHRQPECLFNNLFRLTSQKKKHDITETVWRTPPLADTWWRHQMETFRCCWPFVRGIHRSPVNSPYKGQWRRALMFSLMCTRINNGEAGDLRRHHAHYDVTVMRLQKAFPCHDVFMIQEWLGLCEQHISPGALS